MRRNMLSDELARVDGAPPSAAPLDKHVKMCRSPFQFLRGAAQVFYADLAGGDLAVPAPFAEVPHTRIMGDCHFSNFGFFTEEGSHGDTVVWAPNDFDDAAAGPAVWDVLRYLVSLHLVADLGAGTVAGRYPAEEGIAAADLTPFGADAADRAALAFIETYRQVCRAMVKDPSGRDEALTGFPKKHFLAPDLKKAEKRAAGGAKFAVKSTVGKMTRIVDGRLRFRDDPARFEAVDNDLAAEIARAFRPYVDDAILDLVRRHGAGTGSVNVDRFYLLVGPDEKIVAETLHLAHVVEVKQQRAAAPIHHFPDLDPVNRMAPAHLTIDCQRRMMRRPDLVLDEVVWRGAHWLVRSRHHARVNVDPLEVLAAKKPDAALTDYATACAAPLARAHGRGDRRSTRFEAAMAAALGTGGADLVAAARIYAAQVIEDHRWLCEVVGAP